MDSLHESLAALVKFHGIAEVLDGLSSVASVEAYKRFDNGEDGKAWEELVAPLANMAMDCQRAEL